MPAISPGGAVISILIICTPRLHAVPGRLGVHTKVQSYYFWCPEAMACRTQNRPRVFFYVANFEILHGLCIKTSTYSNLQKKKIS